MPKFMYTVILAGVLNWFYVYYLLQNTAPNTFLSIFWFLIILFFALSITFSIPAYYFVQKRHSEMMDQRMLFRKSFKWSLFISLGAIGVLGLKAFDLLNIFNGALFLLFYVSLFFQLKSKR